MSHLEKEQNNSEEIVISIHRFSNETFAIAKLFIADSDIEPLKQKASHLRSQLPEFAASMQEADSVYRADLNRALSDARLDLEYVLAEGKLPSSIRLWHILRQEDQESNEREDCC